MLILLLGMVSFAIDVGYVAHARTELQGTTDAGTLAGLAKLYSASGADQDFATSRSEIRKYVGGSAANIPGSRSTIRTSSSATSTGTEPLVPASRRPWGPMTRTP
jgi:Flp pilus assembly protein TadG